MAEKNRNNCKEKAFSALAFFGFAFLFAFILISTASASSPGAINSCQTLDTAGVYTLTGNLNSGLATCFNVTANDVTIDCNSSLIEGQSGYYGVNATNSTGNAWTNLTVQNCTISNFTTSIYTGGVPGIATPIPGGKGGNVIVTNSNLSGSVITTGGDVGGCATAGSCYGGNGGTINFTNSNATVLNSTGGNQGIYGTTNAAGGSVTITNSRGSAIYSKGGYATVGPRGNAGSVTAVNSTIVGDIYADGGAQGQQGGACGDSADVNLTWSSAKDIVNSGCKLLLLIASGGGSARVGANVYLTNSNATTINNSGSNDPITPSNAGTIVLENSNVTDITSKGGDNSQSAWGQCLTAGNGGTIRATNSRILSINARGGNKQGCAPNLDSGAAAGNGGTITLSNSTLNISSTTFNLLQGLGGGAAPLNGTAGLLTLNYTNYFEDTSANYGSKLRLLIINNTYSSVQWGQVNGTDLLGNLSKGIVLKKNFAYLNASFI